MISIGNDPEEHALLEYWTSSYKLNFVPAEDEIASVEPQIASTQNSRNMPQRFEKMGLIMTSRSDTTVWTPR